MSFVTHLQSTADGSTHDATTLQTHHGGRPLLVRYDLEAVGRAVSPADIARRPADMWRWHELAPLTNPADRVSLGEQETPLLDCPTLGKELGLTRLSIKDESRLPGGSFKARGMAMAVSRAKELGVTHVAVPTAGNAGGALAAYAARAGMQCTVLMPADTPVVNRLEAQWHGARVFAVDGLINDCGALVGQGVEQVGWFDMSTLKEPYRLEGKKTMGLELAAQRNGRLPDAIFYPTGGGTGLIGMWQAFAELATLGWLENPDARPRMVACQAAGCAPIVDAYDRGDDGAEPAQNAHTAASGLRVPKAFGDRLILDAVRTSGGCAARADDSQISPMMALAMGTEGIALCPETAICLAVLRDMVQSGSIRRDDDVVVFNTGAAQKYVECLQAADGAAADGSVPVLNPQSVRFGPDGIMPSP